MIDNNIDDSIKSAEYSVHMMDMLLAQTMSENERNMIHECTKRIMLIADEYADLGDFAIQYAECKNNIKLLKKIKNAFSSDSSSTNPD